MMVKLSKKGLLGSLLLAGILIAPSVPASAATFTMDFDDSRGQPPAQSNITATFADVPSGVALTLTMGPDDAGLIHEDEFINNLWLNYAGDVSTLSFANVPQEITNIETGSFFVNAEVGTYDIAMTFGTSNAQGGAFRLSGGESVSLIIQDAFLNGFNTLSTGGNIQNYAGLVKVNGIGPDGELSVRMGAAPVSPIPLPAGVFLFIPALAGLFAYGRKRRPGGHAVTHSPAA